MQSLIASLLPLVSSHAPKSDTAPFKHTWFVLMTLQTFPKESQQLQPCPLLPRDPSPAHFGKRKTCRAACRLHTCPVAIRCGPQVQGLSTFRTP